MFKKSSKILKDHQKSSKNHQKFQNNQQKKPKKSPQTPQNETLASHLLHTTKTGSSLQPFGPYQRPNSRIPQ